MGIMAEATKKLRKMLLCDWSKSDAELVFFLLDKSVITYSLVLCLGVGDMTKIFYHGICNYISRLRYISRFIIRRWTRFQFVKKRTLQRWRNVSTDIGYTV